MIDIFTQKEKKRRTQFRIQKITKSEQSLG